MGRQPTACSATDADISDADLLECFVSRRDEAAFAALVRRHGPMVFGVCRRMLRHAQDAEDAFQATFLVLVRKAADIGRRELLGNWLYGVAARVAARARVAAARRQTREAADMERIAEATRSPAESPEFAEAIEEEVQRLPTKYRRAVVLCYLEGRTNEEAAGELRWPVGTVKGRLARAREMLRKRLTRRGLVLSTGAIAAALSPEALAVTLPPALIHSTLQAAASFAAGNAAAVGLVSAQAAELMKGVLHTMFVTKMKTLAALVLALAVVVGGSGGFAYHLLATEADAKKTDAENIQGSWKVVSAKANGVEDDENVKSLKSGEFVISADKITIRIGDKLEELMYTIDPTTKPKTIDIVHVQDGGGEETTQAIYKLEKDKLTICGPHPRGKERPKEFESKEGSDTVLLILQRVKK
ncbi:MAG TPA: sigma-70 family RNA polymerase sigma factor [Gemmataceae bacterium]